ncbi:MAG: hypothetical protein VKQ33_12210 [Candidatus Sericytochromatia bacterium]|nr:hypothetical protein [Candidatus Sericytochromatia bacterium]
MLPAAPDPLGPLHRILGASFVEALLDGARAAGGARLPGNEDPVFGFLQRVLTHLDRAGRGVGLLFPKRDALTYEPFFDFCDAAGAIWVLRKGEGRGGLLEEPGWLLEEDLGDPEMTYFTLRPGAAEAIAVRFLEALASLRAPG